MAHIRQSRPDSGLGFHVKVLKIFQVVPSSLGSGLAVLSPPNQRVIAAAIDWNRALEPRKPAREGDAVQPVTAPVVAKREL